jgi:hypothetical protein
VIAFGKKEATFYAKSGESPLDYLPKPGDPKAAAWSRFIALELVLADMLEMSEVRAEYGIKKGPARAKIDAAVSSGSALYGPRDDAMFVVPGRV